jgi:uncharacterized membrane protein
MVEKMKSRKFLMASVSAALVIANQGLGVQLPAETVTSFAGIVISYLLGQSYVDSKK